MSNITNEIYGEAAFSYLSQPDTAFGKEKFSVDLICTSDEAKPHVELINRIIDNEVNAAKKSQPNRKAFERKYPYKVEGDKVIFKIHSQYKPIIWSKDQKKLSPDISVWKGSKMWVSYSPKAYDKSMGIGCTLYLSSVQIDELVQGTGENNGACPYPNREEQKEGVTL
jgi:hypothetical protein